METHTRTDVHVNVNLGLPITDHKAPSSKATRTLLHSYINTAVLLVEILSSWTHNTQIHVNGLLDRVVFACVFQGKQGSVRCSCDVDWLSLESTHTFTTPPPNTPHPTHTHTNNIPSCPLRPSPELDLSVSLNPAGNVCFRHHKY